MRRFTARMLTVGVLTLGLASCGGGDGGTGPSGSISISVAPGALTLTQGEDGTVTVSLNRSGGFSGSVTLSAQNAPSGVTIGGASIAAGASSAQLTVTAGASASVGTATVTVRATGTDVDAATSTFSLTIDVSAENGFAPSIAVGSVDVDQGASESVTIDVNRASGFAGAVTFSARNVPGGLTVSFDPVVVTGASTELTLEADQGLAAGEYTITIDAETDAAAMPPSESGPAAQAGVVVKSFTLTVVIVQAGGGGPGNVTLTFCTQSGLPLFLAVKNGAGAWTVVNPTGAGSTRTYSFTIGASGGGVAYVLQENLDFSTTQWYGSAAFLNAFGAGLCVGNGEYIELDGTVANVNPATEQATVNHANGTAIINPGGGSAFNLTEVFGGISDPVLATRRIVPGVTDRIYLLRNQQFTDGGTIPVIDLLGPNSFAPVAGTVTINNLPASGALVSSSLFVDGRLAGGLGSPIAIGGSPQNFVGIPEAQRQANEFHLVSITVGPATPPGLTVEGRQVLLTVGDATVPRTVTAGPVMPAVTPIVQGTASNVLMRLQFARQAEYDRLYTVGATQQVGAGSRAMLALVQAGYLPGATVDFAFPDLSPLAGWNPLWNLDNSGPVTWSAGASGHSGGVDDPEPLVGDGALLIGAVRSGQTQP